jgi:hypothetical protein
MSKIDPEMLDQIDTGRGMTTKRDNDGNILAWKGPWLPDWFDNYTECLRENQNARRVKLLRDAGLNEHGQTKEQAEAFQKRKQVQTIRKEKAEAALLASKKFDEGR